MYKSTFIALGSNQGNRLQHLQAAVVALNANVGEVLKHSKIYQTPAMGFQGADFYNACVELRMLLEPQQLLEALQSIEKDLGRQPKTKKGYESRVIDLDLLLYEDNILKTPALTLPHPSLHLRRFVLQPLCDIAAEVLHPKLGLSISELLSSCPDDSEILLLPRDKIAR